MLIESLYTSIFQWFWLLNIVLRLFLISLGTVHANYHVNIDGNNRLTLNESLRYLPADSVAPLFDNPTVSFINSKKKNG